MEEITEIMDHIQEEAGYGTDLIWGNCNDASLGDKIMVTLIATGFHEGSNKRKDVEPEVKKVALDQERSRETVEIGYPAYDLDEAFGDNVIDFDEDDVKKTKSMLGIEENPTYTKRGQMSEELRKRIEAESARREYLRRNNNKPLDNPKIIADIENVPAYARRNVVLEDNEAQKGKQRSSSVINMDDDNNMFISNNSFLYDNVD